ncbi:MAG: T9SS type A sorting domain-containing protein, partial [Fimbriimonadaceae bacterium]|nr:T9SS type A sorting domain-containing protein [Chitinophagales bacterium]
VYPNPATDQFKIEGNLFYQSKVNIRIIHSSGQVVFNSIAESALILDETINIKNYPAGIYFIDIITQKGRSRIMFEKI